MSMLSAHQFPIEGSCTNRDAKSALRDAIRAKLKSSSSNYGEENQNEVNEGIHTSCSSNTDNDIDDDSDSNEDSEGKIDDKVGYNPHTT